MYVVLAMDTKKTGKVLYDTILLDLSFFRQQQSSRQQSSLCDAI